MKTVRILDFHRPPIPIESISRRTRIPVSRHKKKEKKRSIDRTSLMLDCKTNTTKIVRKKNQRTETEKLNRKQIYVNIAKCWKKLLKQMKTNPFIVRCR